MKIVIKTFDDLSNDELYQVMKLRQEVFVVEQDCPYLDADGKDQESLHLLLGEGELIGYARILPVGVSYKKFASIGRVIVSAAHRRKNLGTLILKAAIEACQSHFGTKKIKISAQSYALKLYEDVGFHVVGDPYLEDGIPHQAMEYDVNV